jgi:chromosomal replication initiation ATPase DnaA
MSVGEIERTGIVEEGQRRSQVFSRFIDRRIVSVLGEGATKRNIDRIVAERVKEAVNEAVKRRMEAESLELAQLASGMPKVPLRTLLEIVGRVTGANYADLLGPRRARHLAWPRHFAMWLVKEMRPDLSLVTIGKAFNRDHTTVMSGLKNVVKYRDTAFRQWLCHPDIVAIVGERAP